MSSASLWRPTGSASKGYQAEGHDYAHPDYGGNVSHRAGGMKDLEKLTESGRQWNTDFGIHVNLVESYPEAKSLRRQHPR